MTRTPCKNCLRGSGDAKCSGIGVSIETMEEKNEGFAASQHKQTFPSDPQEKGSKKEGPSSWLDDPRGTQRGGLVSEA